MEYFNYLLPHQMQQQLPDIYIKTLNWSYSQKDLKAQIKFNQLLQKTKSLLPAQIYSSHVLTFLQEIKQTQLYSLMKSIPKGVLHHCHLDCNEDIQFYADYIVNDPIIYLSKTKTQFKIGTLQQATQNEWVSFAQYRTEFQTENQFLQSVANITMFNKENNRQVASKEVKFWHIFQKKIIDFFTILFSLKHFKLYMKYICKKYIANGYDRLQFRSMLSELNQYDEKGNLIKKHCQRKFVQAIDQVYNQLINQNYHFTLGVIFFGLKMFDEKQNQEVFTKVCQLNWDKTIGVDFVQQQDSYGSLETYDNVINKVFQKFPHLNYKKVYHAGQTKNPQNNNLQIAVLSGSVRIGHGINIIQRMSFLQKCKNICFQINHISNMLTGLRDDTRISSSPILLGLGYAITINPDDPGKFGYEDSTVDYFSSIISFNWTLRDLKLIGLHSINHAICSNVQKDRLVLSFNSRWEKWISDNF